MTQKQKDSYQEKAKNKTKKLFKIRFKIVNKFLFCLIILMGVYYIVSVNDLSIKGFVLQDLKKQSATLVEQNNSLELAIMKLESFDNIEKKAQEMNMVKIGKIDYITITGGALAKK